jgi:hypothetical protein
VLCGGQRSVCGIKGVRFLEGSKSGFLDAGFHHGGFNMTIKVGINGFGRIGRMVFRAAFESFKDIDVRDKTDTGGGTLKSFWQFKGDDRWNIPSKTNSSNNLTLNSGYDGSDAERYFADNTTNDPSLGSPNKYT